MDFKKYEQFVDDITSEYSKDIDKFVTRVVELNSTVNVPRLLTGAIGLSSEAGEASDLVKKLVFHGGEYDETFKAQLIKELGDVVWYMAQLTRILDISFDDIIKTNVDKLSHRHPTGFSTDYSDRDE